jgi:hypothetical protein
MPLQAKCEWKDGQAVVGSDAVRIISLVPHSIADICSEQVAGCALMHASRAAALRCYERALAAVAFVSYLHLKRCAGQLQDVCGAIEALTHLQPCAASS